MKFIALDYAQRPLNYAIVDEVDSILIDEARTPLIISGQAEPSSRQVPQDQRGHPALRKDEHYIVDEKAHSASLTDDGVELVEQLLGHRQPVRPGEPRDAPHPEPGLRAHSLYKRDVNYLVRRTARSSSSTSSPAACCRAAAGATACTRRSRRRRTCASRKRTRTMATITFQNLFRLYKKLAGHDRHRRHRGGRVPRRPTSSTSRRSRRTSR